MEHLVQVQVNMSKTMWLALKQVKDKDGKISWHDWLATFVE